jgi:glycosyltransferase involved in cell wall biosynthesis
MISSGGNEAFALLDPLASLRNPAVGRQDKDVLVAIPAYNEERFIGSVVLAARMAGKPVLVIDDGSVDRTADIAVAAGALVERHETNRGKAEALNTAFRFAREHLVTALVVLDGDGQHHADEIAIVLAPILSGEADIVIGSRFLSSSPGTVPKIRRLGQKAMTLTTNAVSGVGVTDSQSGFRAFSRHAIDTLLFASRGFSVEIEMQFGAHDHGLHVLEVPITAKYPDPPKRNVFHHGTQVLNGVLLLAERHRPLLFFGIPGIYLLIVGLAFGVKVAGIYSSTHVLATGYALITVLCTLLGLLALFTGIQLHSMRGVFLDLEKRLIALGHLQSTENQVDTPAEQIPDRQEWDVLVKGTNFKRG